MGAQGGSNSQKTDWEKMLAGELYNAYSPEILEARKRSRIYQVQYNATVHGESEKQQDILKQWLGSSTEDTYIEPPVFLDYGTNLHVGKAFYANFDCVILDCARVDVGDNVKLGPKVQIYTASHPVEAHERIKGPELAKQIKIGHNVWLGGGCIICPGVTIGENTTIGAGAVVTKDIPANVVAVGNPAKVIRELPLPNPSS